VCLCVELQQYVILDTTDCAVLSKGKGRRLRQWAAAVGSQHSVSLGLGNVGLARTYLFTLRLLKCQCCC
jgi:hypothetical protein